MKLTIAILIITCLQVSAKTAAQRINLSEKGASLESVLHEIQQQSGYDFFYKRSTIKLAQPVTINIQSASLQQALDACFKEQSLLTYSIVNNVVVIKKRDAQNAIDVYTQTQPQSIITGRVTDSSGNPLSGVSVFIKGTKTGTITNSDGRFTLQSSTSSGTLVVSYVGYAMQQISFSEGNDLKIVLQQQLTSGNDVVVTAFGIKARSRSVAFAVTSINNTQLTNAGTDNVTNALAGKLPGVDIAATAAGPMVGSRINIRGINSLSGNSRPLIVVNGIPMLDNDVAYTSRGFGTNLKNPVNGGAQVAGATIDDINPNDIESITALNGANGAALYGTMGMNGVVLIETKSGKEAKGLGIDYSMNLTQSKVYGLPDFQQEYGAGSSADAFDTYNYNVDGYDSIPFIAPIGKNVSGVAFGPKFNGQKVLWWDGKIRPWEAQPNNYKSFFSNGLSMNHTIALSGGDEKSAFRLSGSFYDYKGYLPNMRESRYSVLFSGNRKISKIISADIYFNYIYNYRQNPPERIDRANYSILPSDIASLYKDNTINSSGYQWSDSASKYVAGSNLANYILIPLYWDPIMNRNKDGRNTLIGSATITIQPSQSLSIRLRGGTNRVYDQIELDQPFTAFAPPTAYTTSQGGYSKSMESDYVNHADGVVTYNNNIKQDLSLNAFVGFSVDNYNYENNTVASANGLMYNGMYSVSNFKPRIIGTTTYTGASSTGTQSGNGVIAAFGSATLGYKNYLFLSLTDREDWSSNLLSPNNKVNYPSIGGSFIFSDALKMPKFINFGKFRASYGEVGSFGPNYSANTTYTYSSFNGAVTSNFNSANPTLAYGNNIEPQLNKSYEFGIETGMWDDRLRANITYYINKTTRTLLPVPVAYSTGGTARYMNGGSLQSKGLEIQLIGAIVRNNNFQWNMTLNGSTISRKVLSLAPGLTSLQLANPFSATEKATVGGSPLDIYMFTLLRDPKTNKVLVDNDGMPVWSSVQNKVGNLLPKFYGGYINSFSFKRMTLTVLLEYKFGGQVVSYDNQYYTATGLTKNTLYGRDAAHGGVSYYAADNGNVQLAPGASAPNGAFVYHDGIIVDGINASTGQPNTTVVQASTYYHDRYYNFGRQDAVFNNNYLRLREVSLAYNLPTGVANKLHAKSMSVSVIARNLFFIFKTLPYDNPDNSLGTNDTNAGILYSGYPLMRNLGLSLNVGL